MLLLAGRQVDAAVLLPGIRGLGPVPADVLCTASYVEDRRDADTAGAGPPLMPDTGIAIEGAS